MEYTHWLGPLLMLALIPFFPQIIKYVIAILMKYHRRAEKRSLQVDIGEYRKELSTISQVDEFAKYSKVQRKLKKATDQLSALARQDFELNLKAQACSYILAAIIFIVVFVNAVYKSF